MPKTHGKPSCLRLAGLIFVISLAMVSQVWGQSGGMGRGGGMGGLMGGGGMGGGPGDGAGPGGPGGPGRRVPPRFDMQKATTITGQVESLGSYGLAGWRSLPGMAVRGVVLKTDRGSVEVYLGPPSYVARQKLTLQKGDTLEVKGFRVFHEHQSAFFAATVKKDNRTLNVLDEHGAPLWKQQDVGGTDPERMNRGGRDPTQVGGGMMGRGR